MAQALHVPHGIFDVDVDIRSSAGQTRLASAQAGRAAQPFWQTI